MLKRELRLDDGSRVRIRNALPDDAGAVLAFLSQAGGESDNLTFGPEGPGLSEAEEREYLAQASECDNALVLLALSGETIVGSLTFEGGRRPRLRHTGEMGICVTNALTGRGIGRALLECLIAWAEAGAVVRKINLKVRVDNVGAVRLYERLGWVVEGRVSRDTCLDGSFHDCFLMGRAVDPADEPSPSSWRPTS